jgi:hypothetical protein
MFVAIPEERNDAELRRARSTPREDHENLYPRGLPEDSGDGRPPQYDKKCLI